jgi:transposase InsO family protein
MEDGRCRLGLAGRLELVRRIESGQSQRAAAAALCVSPATAHRWWHRWRSASAAERASRECLRARPPRPHSCPWQLGEADEQRILEARARTNYGPARLQGICRRHRSTIWKVLYRHGCSRRRRSAPRQTYRRYEWAQPGALLHLDVKHLQRFDRPGHWATGERSEHHRTRGAGQTYAHCVVDDRSRLAYVEMHGADTSELAGRVIARAAAWMRAQGCGPVEAVMTDNALVYVRGAAFARTLAELGARHIRTPIRTPRWNGKVERFIQTLDAEWAHARTWSSSEQRNRALGSFLRYYNRRRPHTSLGDRPPISRVHQEWRQDI